MGSVTQIHKYFRDIQFCIKYVVLTSDICIISGPKLILLFLISGKNGDDDDLEDWLNDYLS